MYSIFDIFHLDIFKLDSMVVIIAIIDIVCVGFIIYSIYHLFLIIKDCFVQPERANYVHGNVEIDTDTSTSDFEKAFRHVTIQQEQIKSDAETMGKDARDETAGNFNRKISIKSNLIYGDVTLKQINSSQQADNEMEQAKTFDFKKEFLHLRDQNLENINSFLASGDRNEPFTSNVYSSRDSLAYTSQESEENIFPLEFFDAAQPIAHSSPLRKNEEN